MKAIGPSFPEELRAAGLAGLAFAWTREGLLTFGDDITPEQRAAILAVYDAHNPATPAPDIDAVRDAYIDAKAALEEFAANSSLATARPALLKLGLCVEELLKTLRHYVSPALLIVSLSLMLVAAKVGPNKCTVSWTAPPSTPTAPVMGYRGYVRQDTGTYTLWFDVPATVTSLRCPPLPRSGDWQAVVRAYNTVGESPNSNVASFTYDAIAPGGTK